MATPKYHINVFDSPDDKAYIADVPDLTYCSAHSPAPRKTLGEVLIAMDAWIAAAKAHGKRVPKPRYRPAFYAAAS